MKTNSPGPVPDPALPIVLLGPTASGKTRVAVALAKAVGGAVISADSRQVYQGLDIGTGKDLGEYGDVPYYLMDVIKAGERFDISQYLAHTESALADVRGHRLVPIICGGTGMYIQGLIQGVAYSEVPVNEALRSELQQFTSEQLREKLASSQKPPDFEPDTSTHKRLIRALEICQWAATHSGFVPQPPLLPDARVFGLAPDRELRRQRISDRLQKRLNDGLLEEVQQLLDTGLTAGQLIYYGLEYKYCTLYLTGQLDRQAFESKLETEIHRFAKRQMTYFRKMEKDGIRIQWLRGRSTSELAAEILEHRSI